MSNDVSVKQGKHSEVEERATAKFERRRKVMVALWYRASQYLGGIWESQYGGVNDDTIYAWQNALATLSEEQIAIGVHALVDWQDKFPPTIGQFKALCKKDSPVTRPIPEERRLTSDRKLREIDEARARAILEMAKIKANAIDETREESLRNLGRWDD